MQREAIRLIHPEMARLVEDLAPFTSDLMVSDGVTIVDDDDLKEWGLYSDESLLDKYREASDHILKASPPIPGRPPIEPIVRKPKAPSPKKTESAKPPTPEPDTQKPESEKKKPDPKTRPITPDGKVVTKKDEPKKLTPEGKVVTP